MRHYFPTFVGGSLMALIFWISPLVLPLNDVAWSPLASQLAQASGPVEIKWETTSGNINFAPGGKRYAVGVADVDATQQAALEGNPDVITFEIANRGRAGRNIPPPLRAILDAFIDRITGDASSGDDETQDDLLTRLINRALGTFRDDRIDVLLGLKDISVPPQAKAGQTILFRDAFTVGVDTNIDAYPSSAPDYAYSVGSGGDIFVSAANDRVEQTSLADAAFRLIDPSAPTGDQEVTCRLNNTASNSGRPGVRGATSGTLTNYYFIIINISEADEVKMLRTDDGASTLLAVADRGLSGETARFVRVRATGSGATVSTLVQVDGTAPLTFDDTSASRKTSGVPTYETNNAAHWMDDYQVSDAAAQRMYFPEAEVAAVSPTISGTDWEHINTLRRKLRTTPDASTLTTVAFTPDGADHLVSADAHHRQYVGPPFNGDQILMGQIKGQFQCLEANGSNQLFLTFKMYVVSPDGGTVRGTPLAITRDTTNEVAQALTNRNFPQTNLTPVSVLNGDRPVIEVGLGGTPVAAAGVQGHNGSIRWGGSASSGDLPENDTETGTTFRPWIEFDTSLALSDDSMIPRPDPMRAHLMR